MNQIWEKQNIMAHNSGDAVGMEVAPLEVLVFLSSLGDNLDVF